MEFSFPSNAVQKAVGFNLVSECSYFTFIVSLLVQRVKDWMRWTRWKSGPILWTETVYSEETRAQTQPTRTKHVISTSFIRVAASGWHRIVRRHAPDKASVCSGCRGIRVFFCIGFRGRADRGGGPRSMRSLRTKRTARTTRPGWSHGLPRWLRSRYNTKTRNNFIRPVEVSDDAGEGGGWLEPMPLWNEKRKPDKLNKQRVAGQRKAPLTLIQRFQ